MCSGEPEKSCQLSFRALQKRKSTKKEAPKKLIALEDLLCSEGISDVHASWGP